MAALTIQQALDLALRFQQAGKLEEAADLYRQILAHEPKHPDAIHLLGTVAHQAGRNDEAVDLMRQAIALKPDFPKAHSNLGIVLATKGQLDEAIASYRQAIALSPDLPEAYNNLGNALTQKGELDEAVAVIQHAIELRASYSDAHNNLGIVLKEKEQLDEAIAAYRRAIALKPDIPDVHYNLALALLTRGDLREGWDEYEWRWRMESFRPFLRNFTQPLWDGGALDGRTILLHAEQGYGDIIQCVRYLPLVAQRGGKIILECPRSMQRLFEANAWECQIVARGQPLPVFDLHCPMLSLPRAFGTTLDNIPDNVPYLRADPNDVGSWQRRMEEHGSNVKVGLVWAGRATHKNDRNRSIKLATLAPLARAPGERFFSLQKGEAAEQAKAPPVGMEIVDWTGDLKDFADTAALIANLDLVIAVDTAVVHLAGAMGKPVWTLLPFVADWRWTVNRKESPWYPTMRLFRQSRRGDWDGVLTRVLEALSVWIENRGKSVE